MHAAIAKHDKDGKESEVTTSSVSMKVELKGLGATAGEDKGRFVVALGCSQKASEVEWKAAAGAKNNDVAMLLDAFGAMATGIANTDWHVILGTEKLQTWEMPKTKASECTTTKALPNDAHNEQAMHLRERPEPMKLGAQE